MEQRGKKTPKKTKTKKKQLQLNTCKTQETNALHEQHIYNGWSKEKALTKYIQHAEYKSIT